jgi:asparagine synthase (glutamine-hydrolysing)
MISGGFSLSSGPFALSVDGDDDAICERQHFDGGPAATAKVDGDDLILTRDTYGQIPLHYGWRRDCVMAFSSNLEMLLDLDIAPSSVRWVPPQHRLIFRDSKLVAQERIGADHDLTPSDMTLEDAAPILRDLLTKAVDASASQLTGQPAVLVSGGIDSSVVARLVANHHPNIPAYTAVHDPDALDRKMSRLLCDALGIELTEVMVPPPTADDLARLVSLIELPFKAQIELAWPCYWLAEQMHADGIETVFTGEGSDELFGSYQRSFQVIANGRHPTWHHARWFDFLDQHRKNLPRMWKLFDHYGIETRTPFCDEAVVRFSLPLTRDAVYDFPPTWTKVGKRCKEKGVLRKAFADALPLKIVNRDKIAFQSGAGIPKAARAVLAQPERFYRAEFRNRVGGVRL